MCAGKLVVAQRIEVVPSQTWSQLVPKYRSDANVRTFRCLDPLLCMAWAQRTVGQSLGDIAACSGVTRQRIIPGVSAASARAAIRQLPMNHGTGTSTRTLRSR